MAIPAIAPVVSRPSLSPPSPETRDQNHRLTVVQKKILTMHMGMEHVGATSEHTARCCTEEFVNDVTSAYVINGRRNVVTCCTVLGQRMHVRE